MKQVLGTLVLASALLAGGMAQAAVEHLPWTRNATIYELNVRQYSKEGTLAAATRDLSRLKKLGIDIVWLMPVQPIGVKNRKGGLGSYYAIRDYTAVNPEFGTMADFKAFVAEAHKLKMKVILDWVANHTAWDHSWVTVHNDWYKKNDKGEIYPVTFLEGPEPEYWTDVVALDYNNKALWQGMQEAMAFWVREADIDGFRCDVAKLVPIQFWNETRAKLDKIKPMFMLAEGSELNMHDAAFDMTYGWDLADLLKEVVQGKAGVKELRDLAERPAKPFPKEAYRMRFTTNHDFNSWQGSDVELYGPAFRAMAVIAATWPGMPLVYNGQESVLDKRIAFFEKDPIDWKKYELSGFYQKLLKLKKDNPALWNGQYGGDMQVLDTGKDKVFAYRRTLGGNAVTVTVDLATWDYRIDVKKSSPRRR